jgi:hypothetical protein
MGGAGSLLQHRPYCLAHAARPAWTTPSALVLLLSLALLHGTGCMAEQTLGAAHAPKGVNAFVPLCRTLTANLRPKDFKELSALVQQHLHKGKVLTDTGDLLHNVRNPPQEEGPKHAYKTTKTAQELEVLLMEAQRDEQLYKSQLQALIKRLQEAKELPEGDVGVEDLTHCVSTGLDPRLYPYRPKVSFLLQASREGAESAGGLVPGWLPQRSRQRKGFSARGVPWW